MYLSLELNLQRWVKKELWDAILYISIMPVCRNFRVKANLNSENCVGKGYFARDNSIHDVFQRCVVIHGTDGIEVSGNVAFNTYGHCYFLEDGAEQSNVFDRNLGINARGVANVPEDPLQLIPTDSAPSVFWVTNPNNTWTNNVAVKGGNYFY